MQAQADGFPTSQNENVVSSALRPALSPSSLVARDENENAGTNPDPVAVLSTVLSTIPVDLCRIAEEMRAYPEFQAMVLRLASSMLLSPEDSVGTIEEAVVALGTDRLQMLLRIWSLFRERETRKALGQQTPSMHGTIPNRYSFPLHNGALIPENLYLATFLCYADWDFNLPATPFVTTPLFVPDERSDEYTAEFWALSSPVCNPFSRVPTRRALDRSHRKEAE